MTDKDGSEEFNKGEESTDNDEIIELKDEIIEEQPGDEDIIDLVEAADQPSMDDEKEMVVPEAEEPAEDEFVFALDDEFSDELTQDQEAQDDVTDSLGMEVDSDQAAADELVKVEDVSSEQIEAALDRVIKNVFYDKIDRILVEVIERTVTKEIERIKSILLEEPTDTE
ncbi:MAG: hypothetical protein JSV38_07140 [Desulfobacterales bacterium]|nr:MAG: hypothetical protein JSV38_07140 [Desulfobacterales bacterium]